VFATATSFPFPSTLGEVALHLPSLASLFIYSSHGKCPFSPLQWSFPHTTTFTNFPAPRLLGGVPPLLPSLAGLFIYSSVRDCPSSPLRYSGSPALFDTCLLLLLFVIQFVFFLFFLWVGVSLSRGLCWSGPGLYVGVPCAAYLTWWSASFELVGNGFWWCGSPPGFFIYHGVGMLCTGWGCGRVRVLPLLGGFSYKVYLQHLSKILF
jgi:hypothetical protein